LVVTTSHLRTFFEGLRKIMTPPPVKVVDNVCNSRQWRVSVASLG